MATQNSRPDSTLRSRLGCWSREPLLYFVLLSGVLFASYAAVHRNDPPDPETIVVDAGLVNALSFEYERLWQRPPSEQELDDLIESWVHDEIFYREGRAQGLDRDDAVIRQRVIQRMTFLVENLAKSTPTKDEIDRWYRNHQNQYQSEVRYTLKQVYFDPARHPNQLDNVIASAKAALETNDLAQVGDPTMLPKRLQRAALSDVSRAFGRKFTGSLGNLPLHSWTGPVQSSFGLHLVHLEAREPGGTLPLAEVRSAVVRDLERDHNQQALESFYRAARARYSVRIEAPARTPKGTVPPETVVTKREGT